MLFFFINTSTQSVMTTIKKKIMSFAGFASAFNPSIIALIICALLFVRSGRKNPGRNFFRSRVSKILIRIYNEPEKNHAIKFLVLEIFRG
jgi:hypothetical protein